MAKKPAQLVLKKQKHFWNEFKTFITKGNVINLAVGVVLGGAFQAIVNSAVNDVILPLVGWFTKGVDFAKSYLDLTRLFGPDAPLLTLEEAKAKGHVIVSYGNLITVVINFFVIALVVFILVRSLTSVGGVGKRIRRYGRNSAPEPAAPPPTTQKCPYCLSEIPLAATRCAFCTSALPEQAQEAISYQRT
ncbi:MAG: large conductance mechanosensitive channel protein MscL [Oscillospiraceae bacterium]|nr:large conductance mechanosensitive channel protein MscL [Oscillospiraceae bacterium]